MDDRRTRRLDGPTREAFRDAVQGADARALRQLLDHRPALRSWLDEPVFGFGKTAVIQAAANGDRATIDVLVDAGADLDRLSSWEPGGFGVLHSTCFDHPELARWLVDRGAHVDIHAAAGLGDRDRLTAWLDADPEQIHARGPDGQMPLHFAADSEIADLLLDRGADLDARCLDHDSTAAQWAIQRAPELSRHLVERGAACDIFLAVALAGDAIDDRAGIDRVRRLVDADPDCLRARLGRPGYADVPPGCILQWTLGWWANGGRASPHRVARARGHDALYRELVERSPADVRLLVHAWHGEETTALAVVDEHPDVVAALDPEDRRFLADAAWDGNADAVRILLRAGFDPRLRGDHASTPLDRAAFHGFADVLELLLEHDPEPPLDAVNAFGGTPLGALIYGSWNGWRDDGDYPRAARLLATAGADVPPHAVARSRDDVRAVLSEFCDEPIGRSRRHRPDASPIDGARSGSLAITYDPDPTDVHVHECHTDREGDVDERPGPWIWYYRATVHNRSGRALRLVWLDVFHFEHGHWSPGNGRGRALDSAAIVEMLADGDLDADGWLPAGGEAVRPVGWVLGDGPVREPVKWAVVAIDEDDVEHYVEAEIALVPYDR